MKRNGHEWLWHDLVQAMRSRYVRCKSLRWTGRHYETGRLTLCGPQINELAFISIQCHFKDASIIFEKKRKGEQKTPKKFLFLAQNPFTEKGRKKNLRDRLNFWTIAYGNIFFFSFLFCFKRSILWFIFYLRRKSFKNDKIVIKMTVKMRAPYLWRHLIR